MSNARDLAGHLDDVKDVAQVLPHGYSMGQYTLGEEFVSVEVLEAAQEALAAMRKLLNAVNLQLSIQEVDRLEAQLSIARNVVRNMEAQQ